MSIKEDLFKATEIIVDTKLKKYKTDITIPSVIMGIENNGKYKIIYVYWVGQNVWIFRKMHVIC